MIYAGGSFRIKLGELATGLSLIIYRNRNFRILKTRKLKRVRGKVLVNLRKEKVLVNLPLDPPHPRTGILRISGVNQKRAHPGTRLLVGRRKRMNGRKTIGRKPIGRKRREEVVIERKEEAVVSLNGPPTELLLVLRLVEQI